MAADFGIVLPLWSYAADGGALLERAAGDVGLDHVTLPAVTGPHTEFCLASQTGTPHFQTDGGWHFPPEAKTYAAAGVRPVKARWLSGDPLADACKRARRLNLRIFLRLDLPAVRGLVEQEPLLCQCNAWGQPVPAAGACVSNPHLRELLRATLDDLRRYEPAGFELADWSPDCAADRTASRPLDWHPAVRGLLDICFCPACRQIAERAGVDPDHAARSVRVEVERLAASDAGRPGPGGEPSTDPLIQAYIAAHAADCRTWLQRLADTDPAIRHLLMRDADCPAPYGDEPPWPTLLRVSADGELATAVNWDSMIAAGVGAAGLSLPVWRPAFREAAELVRVVTAATNVGVGMFDFEGLGAAAPEAITWLKQAVRFARRG